ncbi:ABC transporter permease [uncultured Enorma sp.]|uniref:ABC transporter permease n=1 Tax=uncultured Enorma sp. TaxID=1714346 RepID=UPI0025D609C9|nr:ABC transporter permease [uncultured Enorma sp.]
MLKYMIKRILFIIPSVFIVSVLTFVVLSLSPGTPGQAALGVNATPEQIEAFNHSVGYDRPLPERYIDYMAGALQGDFGESYTQHNSVANILIPKFPTTLTVAFLAVLFSAALGIPIGVLAALKKGTAVDVGTTTVALLFASIPSFWLGLMFMLLFSLQLGILPSHGIGATSCCPSPRSPCRARPTWRAWCASPCSTSSTRTTCARRGRRARARIASCSSTSSATP